MNNDIIAEAYNYQQKELCIHEVIKHKFKVGWMS